LRQRLDATRNPAWGPRSADRRRVGRPHAGGTDLCEHRQIQGGRGL